VGTSLDHILETDGCDVDLQTRLDKSTPLHLAVQVQDPELRAYLGESSRTRSLALLPRSLPVDD
jgi:hypothetical protein